MSLLSLCKDYLSSQHEPKFDPKFNPPFSFIISGSSGSGKTVFVMDFLNNQSNLMSTNFELILWCSRFHQPELKENLKHLNVKYIKEQIPSIEDLEKIKKSNNIENLVMIIDDLQHLMVRSDACGQIFSSARHAKISVFYITQNFFKVGPSAQDIKINANYLVIFKNVHNCTQVKLLFQRCCEKWKILLEIYLDATKSAHGYLMIDLRQRRHNLLTYRTQIKDFLQIGYKIK